MQQYTERQFLSALQRFRQARPLVHCLTNEVVQEVTANVLLAAGASPAMVVAREEASFFARIASALLVNIGTPYAARLRVMHDCVDAANERKKPWVLDPVAAGGIPWRDDVIRAFCQKGPTVIRGNASRVLALSGCESNGSGVDSHDSSEQAIEPAKALALRYQTVVHVTGATDYITDGKRVIAVSGGDPMATLVVGTGCSLSALVAAYCATRSTPLLGAAAAAYHAKRAADYAKTQAKGPGSFHNAYLDGLYLEGR